MRYFVATLDETEDVAAYRIYVTDCLRGIVNGNKRYIDMVQRKKPKEEDNRTGQEIAMDIVQRLGLKEMKEGGEE